jgi:hypothetical protein
MINLFGNKRIKLFLFEIWRNIFYVICWIFYESIRLVFHENLNDIHLKIMMNILKICWKYYFRWSLIIILINFIIIKQLYAENISLIFKDKNFMTNKSLNEMFILLFSSWKFIALSRFFLVRKKDFFMFLN